MFGSFILFTSGAVAIYEVLGTAGTDWVSIFTGDQIFLGSLINALLLHFCVFLLYESQELQ